MFLYAAPLPRHTDMLKHRLDRLSSPDKNCFKFGPNQEISEALMDLGIKGKKAIVCASSKGLGKACAEFLAADGVDVVLTARGAEALERTATDIRSKYQVKVTAIAGDITTPAGREAVLKACPEPDILINNAGGPPPGAFRNSTRDRSEE